MENQIYITILLKLPRFDASERAVAWFRDIT